MKRYLLMWLADTVLVRGGPVVVKNQLYLGEATGVHDEIRITNEQGYYSFVYPVNGSVKILKDISKEVTM